MKSLGNVCKLFFSFELNVAHPFLVHMFIPVFSYMVIIPIFSVFVRILNVY